MSKSKWLVAGMIVACLAGGQAHAETGLPGGASTLQETYQSWQLTCKAMPQPSDSTATAAKDPRPADAVRPSCSIAQVQLDQASRKLLLSVELRLSDAKPRSKLEGVIVLPFGLAVAKPIVMKSEDKAVQDLAITTCLPVGCIVPLTPTPEVIAVLGKGKPLTIQAQDAEGRAVSFAIQSTGFPEASKRLQSLVN